MKISFSRILACAACSVLLLASAEAKTKKAVVRRPTTTSRKLSSRKKGSPVRSSRVAHTSRRGKHSKAAVQQTTWRNRQGAPTTDRYREIQDALRNKGYLKTESSGTWDANSQEALRHFQADQNIDQTGKVNSLSLIALGLGPSHAPPPDSAAAPTQNK